MKPVKTIIIVVAIIAALSAAFVLLLKVDPKGGEDAAPSFTPLPTISVFKTEKENIVEISVRTEEESYRLTKEGEAWVVGGDSSVKISQSKADTFAYECSSVAAKQVVAENVSDFSIYGLSEPSADVTVKTKDGMTATILLGAETADGSLRYLMMEGEQTVYAKSKSGCDSLAPKLEKMLETSIYSMEEESLQKIVIEKQGSHKIVLVNEKQPQGDGEEPMAVWKMKEPLVKDANAYNINESILKNIAVMSFDSIAAEKAQNLAQFGLDAPYAVFEVSDGTQTARITVGKEEDGKRYVTADGSTAVYTVESSKLSFLETSYLQLVDKLICLENIDTIKTVCVDAGERHYEMLIEGSEDSPSYKLNGTPVSEDAFKSAYQGVLGIMLDDFVAAGTKPSGAAVCTIRYDKKDGTKTTIEFYDQDERNYLIKLNGDGNLLCRKKQVSNLLDKLEKTLAEN